MTPEPDGKDLRDFIRRGLPLARKLGLTPDDEANMKDVAGLCGVPNCFQTATIAYGVCPRHREEELAAERRHQLGR